MISGFASVLIGATFALAVEDAGGVDSNDAVLISAIFSRHVEAETKQRVSVVGTPPASCGKKPTCVADLRRQTGAKEIILLRLVSAITKIAVIAEQHSEGTAAPVSTARADLSGERGEWGPALEALVKKLIVQPIAAVPPPPPVKKQAPPEIKKQAPPENAVVAPAVPAVVAVVEPAQSGGTPIGGIAAAGAGVVLIGAGVVLLVTAQQSIASFEERTTPPCDGCLIRDISFEEANDEVSSIRTRQGIGYAAASIGIAAAAIGAVWIWGGDDGDEGTAMIGFDGESGVVGWSGRW